MKPSTFNPMLKMHLHMLRVSCITIITAIDLVLSEASPEESSSEEPVKTFSSDPLKCQHPRSHWRHTPAMGDPDRVLCQCGETMEG